MPWRVLSILNSKNGGKDLIRIADNGLGMTKEDIYLALQRHATSKLSKLADLLTINTLGFRGEALPSIASIAKLSIASQPKDHSLGTIVVNNGGTIVSDSNTAIAKGTIIEVKDLFFNLPVRQKFLKTDYTELSQVVDIVEKIILANPQIQIKLIHNGKVVLQNLGQGSLLEAIVSINNKNIAKDLLPIDYTFQEQIKITGYLSVPTLVRNDRKCQVTLVNQRPIFSNLLNKAIMEGYSNTIPSNKYPFVYLNIALPGHLVDVNVHPTKKEVRFADNLAIFSALKNAVLQTLINTKQTSDNPDLNSQQANFLNSESITLKGDRDSKKHYSNIWQKEMGEALLSPLSNNNQEIDLAFTEINAIIAQQKEQDQKDQTVLTENKPTQSIQRQIIPEATPLFTIEPFQIYKTFIVTVINGALAIIDQHTAHERLLFNQLSQQYQQKNIASQSLLFPINLDLSLADKLTLQENLAIFTSLGFEIYSLQNDFRARDSGLKYDVIPENHFAMSIDLLEQDTWLIKSVPATLPNSLDFAQLVSELLADLQLSGKAEIQNDDLLKMIACKGAVKAGDTLNPLELRKIVANLAHQENSCLSNHTCPHGRPVLLTFEKSELEKMFKRR